MAVTRATPTGWVQETTHNLTRATPSGWLQETVASVPRVPFYDDRQWSRQPQLVYDKVWVREPRLLVPRMAPLSNGMRFVPWNDLTRAWYAGAGRRELVTGASFSLSANSTIGISDGNPCFCQAANEPTALGTIYYEGYTSCMVLVASIPNASSWVDGDKAFVGTGLSPDSVFGPLKHYAGALRLFEPGWGSPHLGTMYADGKMHCFTQINLGTQTLYVDGKLIYSRAGNMPGALTARTLYMNGAGTDGTADVGNKQINISFIAWGGISGMSAERIRDISRDPFGSLFLPA